MSGSNGSLFVQNNKFCNFRADRLKCMCFAKKKYVENESLHRHLLINICTNHVHCNKTDFMSFIIQLRWIFFSCFWRCSSFNFCDYFSFIVHSVIIIQRERKREREMHLQWNLIRLTQGQCVYFEKNWKL